MARRSSRLTILIALLTGACAKAAVVPLAPARAAWEHCWWTVLRTTLPPDTVAARFQYGFAAAGLLGAEWSRSADTIRVHAGPTQLEGDATGARYESRVVAFAQGDTTHFRYFVAIDRPPRGWASAADSVAADARRLPVCAAIAKAAAIRWSGPASPNGEETLDVWKDVP